MTLQSFILSLYHAWVRVLSYAVDAQQRGVKENGIDTVCLGCGGASRVPLNPPTLEPLCFCLLLGTKG